MTKIPDSPINDQSRSGAGGSPISGRDTIRILMVILLWAICYPLITTGLATFPPFVFATLRSLLAGGVLLAAAIALKRPLIPDRKTWLSLVIVALTFTTLAFAGMFLAAGRVTPGLATVIANVQPLLAACLGYFVLTERLTRTGGLALLVGFAGIVVIAFPGLAEHTTNSTPIGIGLVLVGATGVAIGNVILKKLSIQIDPIVAMAWTLLLGAVPLSIAAVVFESTADLQWNLSSIANLFILSIFGTALAFLWWLDVLSRVGLNLLNTYTFLTPVVALLIGMVFYAERLTVIEWVGIFIIIIAVYLGSRAKSDAV